MNRSNITPAKLEILERRKRVAAMYRAGRMQWEIAERLKVDPATISRDLKAVQAEWVAAAVMDLNDRKALELAKVDRIESAAWRGYWKSSRDAERSFTKKVTESAAPATPGGPPATFDSRIEASLTKEGQAGNPAFLATALKCVERRCKILGVDAPQKLEGTGPQGEIIVKVLGKNVSMDDL